MEKLKRMRSAQRTAFTRTLGALNAELNREVADKATVQATLAVMEHKTKELNAIDDKILDLMLEEGVAEKDCNQEMETADEYKIRFETIRAMVMYRFQEQTSYITSNVMTNTLPNAVNNPRKYQLPKIEIKKFSGEPKGWLRFWSFFQKIDEDAEIKPEEKFDFLLQSMVEGSRASEYVNSFPPTAANYPKVIQGLKSRFGREDLLVEVYMRELLKLVLSKSECTLASVYDKLETQLRSLESLGVTTATCAAMLFPLVESSLPEEILRAWQRKSNAGTNAQERLQSLMKFLEEEVQNEERIQIAKNGFDTTAFPSEETSAASRTIRRNKVNVKVSNGVATAAGLLAAKEPVLSRECVFCQESHDSAYCEKAKQMSLESRQAIAKEKRACFACLRLGHKAQRCRYQDRCPWCKRKHVLLMCKNVSNGKQLEGKPSEMPKETENLTLSCNNASCVSDVYLQTLRVKLRGPAGECIVRALIDPGSHKTYVLRTVAEKTGLSVIGQQKMTHLLFGGERSDLKQHREYKCYLDSMDGSYGCCIAVLEEEIICQRLPIVSKGAWVEELLRSGIKLSDDGENRETISLLIGADIAGRLYTGNILQLNNGPTALETKFGWTLMGRTNSVHFNREDAALTVLSMFNREAKLSDLWELDVLGIDDPVTTLSREAHLKAVKQQFQRSIRVNEEGRFEVNLPWKENHPPLCSNRRAAEKRLHGLTRKLDDEGLYAEYDKVFDDWLEMGVVERVPCTSSDGDGYFLPHRHIVKNSSTTRIRPVFDASAGGKDGPSLNQCLEAGPNLIELIPDLLLRFRENKIGVAADIAKAFLRLSVAPVDRDALRFLWWSKSEPREIVEYRHRRVVFGINSSPFLLGATIEYLLDNALKAAKSTRESSLLEKLKRSFYVDDCITSVVTPEEGLLFKQNSVEIMRKVGFDLRGWEFTGSEDGQNPVSILGIHWDKNGDTLSININFLDELDGFVTKRKILSVTHKVFDPLGWVCPVLLLPKLLLQSLWSQDIDWDSVVPPEIAAAFRRWFDQVPMLRQLKMPRWIFGEVTDKTTLHVFVDASKNAYAAVLFVRVEREHKIEVQLVQAKSRVGPTKEISIPRMELLAATLGARLMNSVSRGMNFSNVEATFWSDSSTVLTWLRQGKQWSRFVWNRVEEIRKFTDIKKWRHVSGSLNPADLPSRGCTAPQLIASRWWEGPAWLSLPQAGWPQENFTVSEEEVNAEISKTSRKNEAKKRPLNSGAEHVSLTNPSVSYKEEDRPWYLFERSNYTKIVRIMAWILRLMKNIRTDKSLRTTQNELNVEEISLAEKSLIKLAQRDSFEGVSDQRLKELRVYLDEDGLMITKTIISNRMDDSAFLCPAVMEPIHPFTKLLIEHTHRSLNHAGVSTTMTTLRERFWILSSRRAVRSVIDRCVICRRHAARNSGVPTASLPEDRVRDAAVFEVVGVDYAGPLFLRDGKKAWICLFTCAVYRAVHLELVTVLSTNGFLEALRRFVARRGRPSKIYSDNGTNFTGAHSFLKKVDWKKVNSHCATDKIGWRFNPPSAAWWGGWWERIVRILKDLLKRTLGKASLSYEEMTTVLCECESIINARPITYVSDVGEGLRVIKPEMFLKEISEDRVPDLDYLDKVSVDRRLRYRQRLREELRMRFRSEYLGQLARHSRGTRACSTVRVGDIVLISSDNQKRLDWPLARVTQLIEGNDGIPRVARLKTASGELVRPLQRIIVLEDSPVNSVRGPENKVESSAPEEREVSPKHGEDVTDQRNNSFCDKSLATCARKGNGGPLNDQQKKTRGGRLVKVPRRFFEDFVNLNIE